MKLPNTVICSRKNWRSILVPLFVLFVIGCSTKKQSTMTDMAVVPLDDLNLMQIEIPAVLLHAQKNPYAIPPNQNCISLDTIIRTLDEVLEPDYDAVQPEIESDLIERGAETAEETAVSSIRRTVEGIVPFRGWVRKLSGAERRSKQVSAAITAGVARRAFIKGIKAAHKCP